MLQRLGLDGSITLNALPCWGETTLAIFDFRDDSLLSLRRHRLLPFQHLQD